MSVFNRGLAWLRLRDCGDGSENGGAAPEDVSTGSGRTLGRVENRIKDLITPPPPHPSIPPRPKRKPSPSNVSVLLLLLLPPAETLVTVVVMVEEEVEEVFGERGLLTCVPVTF